MPIYNVISLVVVILVGYDSVNYACVWKKRGSSVEAVWQGGKGFGIGVQQGWWTQVASLTAQPSPSYLGLGGRIYRLPPLPPTPKRNEYRES